MKNLTKIKFKENGEFNHFVTVLDVLFNTGKEAVNYIFTGDIEEI